MLSSSDGVVTNTSTTVFKYFPKYYITDAGI